MPWVVRCKNGEEEVTMDLTTRAQAVDACSRLVCAGVLKSNVRMFRVEEDSDSICFGCAHVDDCNGADPECLGGYSC
jgi:hypothetical protein